MFTANYLLLAGAISFDSFLAGVSYGYARIRVPFRSLLIAGTITGFVMFLSMSLGDALSGFTGAEFARWLGASLLVLIGASALANGHARSGKDIPVVRLSFLGVVVHVIREPQSADLDRSRVIDSREALVLGTALAMDAFGVGLGAALAGMRILGMTLLAAFGCPLMLWLGAITGSSARLRNTGYVKRLPAWTLVTIGLMRFL